PDPVHGRPAGPRYADPCNRLVTDPRDSRYEVVVLRRHCEEVGENFDEIEKTSLIESDLQPGRQSAADVIANLRPHADEGIEHVIVNMPDVHDLRYLETFGHEIIPAVAELVPA